MLYLKVFNQSLFVGHLGYFQFFINIINTMRDFHAAKSQLRVTIIYLGQIHKSEMWGGGHRICIFLVALVKIVTLSLERSFHLPSPSAVCEPMCH